MDKIDNEIRLLLEMASAGELPGYKQGQAEGSFYAEKTVCTGLAEYYSGENDALEHELKKIWAHDAKMQKAIPVILATVEKSRGQKGSAVPRTELYNYTM